MERDRNFILNKIKWHEAELAVEESRQFPYIRDSYTINKHKRCINQLRQELLRLPNAERI